MWNIWPLGQGSDFWRGQCDFIVKMYLILEYLLFYTHIYFRKTKRINLLSTDLYLICKIYGLWDSSGPRAGAIFSYSENVFNPKKKVLFFTLIIHLRKNKFMPMMSMRVLYLDFVIHTDSGPRAGPICPHNGNVMIWQHFLSFLSQ